MALCQETASIKLEAVKAFWGVKHCRTITTVADVAGSLDGTYFDLNVIDPVAFTEVEGYVYFNTDPVIAGKTGYAASTSNDDDAATVAAAIAAALSSVDVNVEVSGSSVEVQNKYFGGVTAELDSGASGFSFEVGREGIGGELGKTAQGGSTLTLETSGVELKSDQTAEIVIGESFTGSSATIDMPLIELDKEKLELILGQVTGDILTPGGGTSLVGYGESRLYQLLNALGGTLILHPIRLPDTDKSADVIVHKSAPLPQDINFSGSDIQTLNVTFKAYLDSSVNSKINLFAIGDWTQDLA
jgi:hypothetical protein